MSNIVLAAGGDDGYQISRSLRFRNSASASLTRTSGSGNRKTYTISFWMKRGALVDRDIISSKFTGTGSYPAMSIAFDGDRLRVWDYTGSAFNINLYTTAVYRDPSAWYHVVLAVDTTQATAANRVRLYVNGTQVTSFSTATYPAQNTDMDWNLSGNTNTIGGQSVGGYGYFDGYLADVNGVSGLSLDASNFGETDAVTGVWKPKKYGGTYGTNGFYLNFSDNSNNTAATIGKDYSGNGNNWTPNNISVTSGVTYDSMLDVPTQWADGGNGRGNYCVGNPLTATSGALTNANLTYTGPSGAGGHAFGTFGISSGKYYWEATVTSDSSEIIGIQSNFTNTFADIRGYSNSDGKYYVSGTGSTYGATYTTNDVIGVALDMDAGTLTFYKNNTSQGQATSGLTGTWFPAFRCFGTSSVLALNFGQRPFAYTPPTGFKALNTQNLPAPTILKGNQFFDVTTYTGNGGATRTFTGLGFQPDFIWTKNRDTSGYEHLLFDSVRGFGVSKDLSSNTTGAEGAVSGINYGYVSAATADGYTVVDGGGTNDLLNQSAKTYVAWQWKESATAGFDIVTQTATASGNQTINHNLGVTPAFAIIKARTGGVANWPVWIKGIGTDHLNLNTTAARSASGYMVSQSSTTFVFSGSLIYPNNPFVAYLFAEVDGFSRFGSYTGNGSSDGPFVFCGFRPRYILIKRSSNTQNWLVFDTARGTFNCNTPLLYPNLSNAEDANAMLDILSNGFKFRSSALGGNDSGDTFIFAAFAEHPFKNSLAR